MSLPFMGDLHFYGERPPVARPTGVLRVIGVGAAATVRLVISVVSAYRRYIAVYTAADPLLFADVYGRIVKKKADAHGYISASTG